MIRQHTILGGGIIGLMSAHYLTEVGYSVTIIDRVETGDPAQTSYGNAGVLAIASTMPLGEPSIIRQGIKMLFDSESSLSIPWTYRIQILPWLIKLIKESTPTRHNANARAIAELNRFSNNCWRDLIEALSLQSHLRDTGWLKVFETDVAMQAMQSQLPFLDEYGLTYQQLDKDEVRQLEPSLAPHFKHGILQTQAQSIRQPHKLLTALSDQLKARGVTFLRANITNLKQTNTGFEVIGEGFSHNCKQLTVACGAWSQRLLSTLGQNYPLETERGYHLMFNHQSQLGRSVMHMEESIVLTPMDEGLRMTTGVELAGLDAPANINWARKKQPAAERMFKDLSLTETSNWLGFRPSLPDSNPIIGLHPTIKGLSLAFGHGHLGMTQSTATGKLLAQLITGEETAINVDAYRAGRF
jgi:glycine/D-amino acid oxidase-like deaminating enzyme